MIKESSEKDLKIEQLLWREVVQKSLPASVSFIVMAILVYFYHFNTVQFKNLIQTSCIVIFFANFLRIWVTKKVLGKPSIQKIDRRLFQFGVWINVVAWSCIIFFGSYETKFQGIDFVILNLLIMMYLASALITLSYDKTLFFPVNVIILLPMMGLSLYYHHTGVVESGLVMTMIYFIFFAYQAKQSREFRNQLLVRFGYEVDLESSYAELENKTTQLIHTSKISALGNMAGGLAHEVNNSLMMLLGAVTHIERGLKEKHIEDERIEHKFQIVKTNGKKIATVVQGLKYFAQQLDSPDKETKTLHELMDLTAPYYEELLKVHSIKITHAEIPDVKISCQPYQLVQVLFNVITNAYDAVLLDSNPDKWIKIDFDQKDNFVFIKIKNSGPAIPPEVSQHLFQPFFSTKPLNQGTGLSLSISKGIAMEHSGDLEYEFDEPVTTFTLKLPVA